MEMEQQSGPQRTHHNRFIRLSRQLSPYRFWHAARLLSSIIIFRSKNKLIGPAIGLLAAILGVMFCLIHNQLLTDQAIQSSAIMKSLWSKYYGGPDVQPIFNIFLSFFGPPSKLTLRTTRLILLVLVIANCLSLVTRIKSRSSDNSNNKAENQITIWLGSALTLIGYCAFYSLNTAAMQPWYSAGLIIPAFGIMSTMTFQTETRKIFLTLTSALMILLVTIRINHIYKTYENHALVVQPRWPHQTLMLKAGKFLQHENLDHKVGSWNAGIIGYYQGGEVINLDGLVNNDIYEHASMNNLQQYIDNVEILYIIDFKLMLENETLQRRGGYEDPAFLKRLTLVKEFSDINLKGKWREIGLFEIQTPIDQNQTQ